MVQGKFGAVGNSSAADEGVLLSKGLPGRMGVLLKARSQGSLAMYKSSNMF